MAEEPFVDDELEALADALRSLVPRATSRSRDQHLSAIFQFATPQSIKVSQAQVRFWKLSTAFSSAVAMTLAVVIGTSEMRWATTRSDPPQVAQLHAKVPANPLSVDKELEQTASEFAQPFTQKSSMSYIAQRNLVLVEGIESLPAATSQTISVSSRSNTFQDLIESINNSSNFGR